ncbi:hypothetical protein GTR02_20930 [Kineococcus sp. R8]|nr:hypothetical protein [Kineococcus siccus]
MAGASAREAGRDRGLLLGVLVLPVVLAAGAAAVARAVAGPGDVGALRWVLPGAAASGLVLLALPGTAGPLLRLRARGTVLLVALSPAGRSTSLLAGVPVRLGLAAVQLALTVLLCAAGGVLAPRGVAAVAGLLLTHLLGAGLAVAVGALAGGLLRAGDGARGVLGLATAAALVLGGVLLPLSALPAPAAGVLSLTPTALLGDALRAGLTGVPPAHPPALAWAVLAVATGLAWAATIASLRLGARRSCVPDRPAPPPEHPWT